MRTKLLCGLIAAVLTLPAMADKPAFSVNGQAVSQARFDCLVLSSDASQTRGWAFRLPGRGAAGLDAPVWLPIDAKFPRS
jgi:hypothetical protein